MANTATALDVKITFNDLVLTEEEIEKNGLAPEDLFEVQFMGEVKGPFYKEALKNSIEVLDPEEKCLVKSLSDEDWTPVFSHPYFQRRKLQVVEETKNISDTTPLFLLDSYGQKSGPFVASDIEAKIASKDLLFTDVISIDGGKTWNKIFQIERFDRRNLHPQIELPELPRGEVFSNSTFEVIDTLNSQVEEIETEDAIIGLAFINNVNSNKAQDKAFAETMAPIDPPKSNWKWISALAIAVVIVVIAMTAGTRTNTTKVDEISVPEKSNYVPAKSVVKRPIPKVTPTNKAPLKTMRKVVPKRSVASPANEKKSFKDSDAYKIDTTINDQAIQGDFVEGEMLLPEAELTEEELLELEEKLSKRFSITPVTPEEGPESEEGLFDEEASF